jgi:hypothetical protein
LLERAVLIDSTSLSLVCDGFGSSMTFTVTSLRASQRLVFHGCLEEHLCGLDQRTREPAVEAQTGQKCSFKWQRVL